MTENNNGVQREKFMSKKNRVTTQGRKEEEVSTLCQVMIKTNVIVNYLFIKLSKGLSKVKDK